MLMPGFKVERTDVFEARPRLRADEQLLFQLYMAAVPGAVRAAEAMTLDEWAALYPGRKRWQPSFTGSRQQYVWELGTSIVGWMELTFGQRSQYIELLVNPRYEDAADRLLRYALLQVSPKAPVYIIAREYQASPGPGSATQRFPCGWPTRIIRQVVGSPRSRAAPGDRQPGWRLEKATAWPCTNKRPHVSCNCPR